MPPALIRFASSVLVMSAAGVAAQESALPSLTKLPYNHAETTPIVDLQVGLWAQPLPMDWDGDGDLDMVVATAGVPSNGVWLYENASEGLPRASGGEPVSSRAPASRDVVFRRGRRVCEGPEDITISYVNGKAMVTTPGALYPNFGLRKLSVSDEAVRAGEPAFAGLEDPVRIDVRFEHGYTRTRANQWKFSDYDGDGAHDLVIGLGVWDEYGWDDAFNPSGVWTNGPLHGYVYVARNEGTDAAPKYARPEKVIAGEEPVDVYGAPSPNFADFDGDGDLDLVCGEFLDALTYFENIGTRTAPKYAKGRYLARDGRAIRMDLQMLQVIALDWDGDDDADLVVGQEDGRVALWEHTGRVVDRMPVFELPRFFRQEADYLRVGVLPTPAGVDWDGDGDMDFIAGDTAGYINLVENIGYFEGLPIWNPPVYLGADGDRVRIQAGTNGGIQGPCEAKWGYTCTAAGDWDMDGDPDIVINSIWGEILWYENTGTRTAPKLAAAQRVYVAWDGPAPKPAWFWWDPKGDQLVTQWRTTPYIGDMNGDGVNDLVSLDHEGYLALFAREKRARGFVTKPGARIFLDENGAPLCLNDGWAGKSGRRKYTFADWDGDGKIDLLLDGKNVDFWRNVATKPGEWRFKNEGPLAEDKLAGHTTAPTIVDWNKDTIPDLVVSAEDGCLYYLENPRTRE